MLTDLQTGKLHGGGGGELPPSPALPASEKPDLFKVNGVCFNWPHLKIMGLVETVSKTFDSLVVHQLSFSKN